MTKKEESALVAGVDTEAGMPVIPIEAEHEMSLLGD